MLFRAIIERELRISSRNWRTYYSRVAVGAWALALCIYLIWLVKVAFGGGPVGVKILGACSMMSLVLSLFNGMNRTCDCLSSEKREDTLGLLFLTHLKPHDIVLGKLCAHGLRTLYLLVAITPILAIPIFLGGVTGLDLVRVVLVLLNSLLLSLGVGLLVSSIAWSQRTAHGIAGMIIAVLGFGLPATAYLLQRYTSFQPLALGLNLFSPTYALFMSDSASTGLTTNYFGTALVLQFGLAMGALAGACWCVPHFWKIKSGRSWTLKQWIGHVAHGDSEVRAKRRSRMLERNPIFWLNNRDRFAVVWPILFAVLSFGIAVGCILYFEIPREPTFAVLFCTLALNDFAMRIRVGSIASLRLGADRQSGALEMVLSTPLTVREIVRGVWNAIRAQLLWTYVPLLVAYCVIALLFLESINSRIIVVAFFLIFSLVDFVAMGYVAMWNGMRMRNVQQAAGQALLRVLILPWSVWATIMPFAAVSQVEIGTESVLVTAAAIWGISTVLAIRSARRNLFAHFREAATDRYNFERRTGLLALLRRCSDIFLTVILLRSRRPSVLN